MSVSVSEEKIDGVEVDFKFDASTSNFSAYMEVEGHSVVGKTLDECRKKARSVIRRRLVKLAIGVHEVDAPPEEMRDYSWHDHRRKNVRKNHVYALTIRGLDGRSGDPLVEYEESGRKARNSRREWRGENGKIVRRLSPAEVKEYREIRDALDAATERYEAWIEEREIKNLEAFVKAEIDKRVAAAEEADAEPDADPRSAAAKPTRRRSTRR